MQNYMTARMFAREYGTLLGGAWTAMFAGAIMSVRSGNPLATLLMLLGAGGCIILPFYFTLRYRNKPFNEESGISYFHALYFSFIMFFYASMISAAATFVYFQWLDHGTFISSLFSALESIEENKASLPPSTVEMQEKEKELIYSISGLNISPIEQALGMFNQGLIGGLVASFIFALIGKKEAQ